jgi:hypothetical protein
LILNNSTLKNKIVLSAISGGLMKTIFAMTLFVSSFCFADEVLKYTLSVGFSPDPFVETIVLQNDGKLIQHAEYSVSKKSITVQLAELSPIVMQKINLKVLKTDTSKPMVDKNVDAPHCMDGPVTTISLVKAGQETMIHKNFECHNAGIEDFSAQSLTDLMNGLVALGR